MRLVALLNLLFLAAVIPALQAYDFIGSLPLKWRPGEIPMDVQLDSTMAPRFLRDGKASWNSVAQEAIDMWNGVLREVRFESFNGETRFDGNDENEIFFSTHVYGRRFGFNVLAITTSWRIGRERVEGDTIFNTDIDWDSYRGPLDSGPMDFRRVALHEFGHTLGLDHPDSAGQVQIAIMNATISDLDTLAEDDILGVHALYPGEGRYALNVLTVGGGQVQQLPAPDQAGTYPAGTLVTLVARPERRNRFLFWSGDENRTGRKLRVRVADDLTVFANFSTNVAPVVLTQPRSQFASRSDRVSFAVRVSSGTSVDYQWEFNGQDLPGETNPTLVLDFVGHENSGLYSCRIANARGETVSKPARLVVDGY